MGYRCPVCGDPQADDVHLANHLAFTAMVRGGDHESWLDEHVPGWGQLDDDGLAEEVTDLAESAEYPQVFEDTTDHTHENGEPHRHEGESDGSQHSTARSELPDGAEMLADLEGDEDVDEIIQQARELTRQRREGREQPDDDDS